MIGSYLDILIGNSTDDGLFAHVRLSTERGALYHLSHMIGQAFREAAPDGWSRNNTNITTASTHDHIGSHVQQFNKGVDAGQSDNSCGLLQMV